MSVEDGPNHGFEIEKQPAETRAIMTYAMQVVNHNTYEVARKTTRDFFKDEFCFDDEYAQAIVDNYIANGSFPDKNAYIIDRDAARDKLRIFMYEEILPYYELFNVDMVLADIVPEDTEITEAWLAWVISAVADRTQSRHTVEVCKPSPLDETNQCLIGSCPLKTITSDINRRLTQYDLEDSMLPLVGQMINEGSINYFEDEKLNISRRIEYAARHGLVPKPSVSPMILSMKVAADSMYRRLEAASLETTER